jgi:hypothetical protein
MKHILALILFASITHAQDCPTELYFCLQQKRVVSGALNTEIYRSEQYRQLLELALEHGDKLRRILRREKRRARRECK